MRSQTNLYKPYGTSLPPGKVPIEHGGTNQTSISGLTKALNAITTSEIGAINGIAGYTEGSNTINLEQFDKEGIMIKNASLSTDYNKSTICVKQIIHYTIVGYNASTVYNIVCNTGTLEQNNGIVTYTSPDNINTNNVVIAFNKTPVYTYALVKEGVYTPSIVTPSYKSINQSVSLTVTATEYGASLDGQPSTHACSSWELSTTQDFTNVIKSSLESATNLTSWYVTGLEPSTTYYVRVRYQNNLGSWSDWSEIIPFSTAAVYINKPVITSPTNNSTIDSETTATITTEGYSVHNASGLVFPHTSTDWQVSTDNSFSELVVNVTGDTANKTTYEVTGLTKTTTYYVRVRYYNDELGYSDWSNVIAFSTVTPAIAKPSITSPTNGATSTSSNSCAFTSSEYTLAKGELALHPHASSDWQVATSSTFETIVAQSMTDSTNKVSWTATGLAPETTYYARVRYNGTDLSSSDWSEEIMFTTKKDVSINTPEITIGSNIGYNKVVLTSSAYSVNNGTTTDYPHTYSQWQIATNSNFEGGYVTIDTGNSEPTTTYTATTLTANTTYYARVRYYNTNLGWSNWSASKSFTTSNAAADASGRSFYRHSSGMGTVMTWRDKAGRTHNTLVLDAQYRTNLQWYNGSYTDISGLTNYTNSWYYYNNGSSQSATATSDLGITDATINGYSGYFEDAGSSKSNTTAIINSQGSSTSHAAGWCRSKSVNGTPCDLPNIQTLIRIHASMFMLDALDASTSNNRYKFTMAKSGNSSNWYFGSYATAWSSTEYYINYAWSVHYDGSVYNGGKNNAYGVIPVLEV